MQISKRSRPSRARGLKLVDHLRGDGFKLVAPLAGAWIETVIRAAMPRQFAVAPLAGAWIETCVGVVFEIMPKCRAPRGRVD